MGEDQGRAGEGARRFEAERPRLIRLGARILGDADEAQDVVQQAWLRLQGTGATIQDLPAWLTTVTTRLCLDRLRMRTPEPVDPQEHRDLVGVGEAAGVGAPVEVTGTDPHTAAALAEGVGVALTLVLDRLTPTERVAFVLHDSFAFTFAEIAAVLETTPAAARQLASRARRAVRSATVPDRAAERAASLVDAFMAAAKGGDLERLLTLLAADVVVDADSAAVLLGTPERIEGRDAAAAFFEGSAHAALPVLVDDPGAPTPASGGTGRPGAAWFDRGRAMVLFDFALDADAGVVTRITFRADPEVLSTIRRRRSTT